MPSTRIPVRHRRPLISVCPWVMMPTTTIITNCGGLLTSWTERGSPQALAPTWGRRTLTTRSPISRRASTNRSPGTRPSVIMTSTGAAPSSLPIMCERSSRVTRLWPWASMIQIFLPLTSGKTTWVSLMERQSMEWSKTTGLWRGWQHPL